MPRFVFANRVSALITATISPTDLSVQLETGAGALLPVLNPDQVFRATLISVDGTTEIVNGSAVVGDVVTIQRGLEGTPAATFASGSRFELRLTAGLAGHFLQRSGGTMVGPLDMADQEIQRAKFATPTAFNTIHVQVIRSAATPTDLPFNGPQENAINIPPNTNVGLENRRPRYFGRPIVNAQMFDNITFDYHGDINNLPSHLKACDGTNGTLDLRGRFCRGWDATFGVGTYEGADVRATSQNGQHNHGGLVVGTAITIAQMPPHAHAMLEVAGNGGTEGSDARLGRGTRNTELVGGGEAHQHGVIMEPDHQHLVTVLPAFVSVGKVMFKV